MKERPILFSAPMVRAILTGKKTQTRRIVKGRPENNTRVGRKGHQAHIESPEALEHCPYGKPGDRLWVRETWVQFVARPDGAMKVQGMPNTAVIDYKADYSSAQLAATYDSDGDIMRLPRWRPSIHMPRWASRITLEVRGVRIERLQDISEEDAKAEGMQNLNDPYRSLTSIFRSLWDGLNGERAPWESNPLVWVIEFRIAADAERLATK
jgi:hypothetical protein